MVPGSANIALRNLGKVLGLSAFMLALSPRLTLLALLEVPLAIVARKIYNARYQVMVDIGREEQESRDGDGWLDGDSRKRVAGWGQQEMGMVEMGCEVERAGQRW